MLLSDNKKKKLATIIIGKMKPDAPEQMSEAPMVEGAEHDDSIAKNAAAEELIAAIDAKSPSAIISAFEAMMELCAYKSEEDDKSSES